MKAILYTIWFIVMYVWTGKHSMAEAMDFYHFAKTMICIEKIRRKEHGYN